MRTFILVLTLVMLNLGMANAASFTDNGNETVTDNVTTLIWQQCSNGLSGAGCATGTATTTTWENAIIYCEGLTLGGSSAWRLPNIKELRSIVDNTASSSPLINATYFPNARNGFYWSATTEAVNSANAWHVPFSVGSVTIDFKTVNDYVRCVR